ncbi:hypothetical protein [Burkholderia multivorans]|uniref:VirB4 family type IV secretion/conjugal transfer ATPase n=1 Tax=Burkholderia multivorans TaxID=87883 RepID=UPI000756EE68|nr:hypothetical protein [Burkholderia multivorans]KVS16168.1 hypothetical protein WK33_06455 [Burkholderia multivorans]MBU9651057.1 hypothetical protein [Burkholderia multivorans]MCO1451063.1 hypothetical protein [Burkholderia multivorans]MDN8103969.1 hypothetical protein [Burkholderia multivorans]PRG70421.1 hypothetical protein C6T69_15230 [Burkholderia multivorans]
MSLETLDRHFDGSPVRYRSEGDLDQAADLKLVKEIPFGVDAYYNDHTLNTIDGAKIQVIRLTGLSAEMLDDDGIKWYKRGRNEALRAIADSSVGIYVHDIRRKQALWPAGKYRSWFPRVLNDRFKERYERSPLYHHEIYISVVRYRHYTGSAGLVERVFGALDPSGGLSRMEREERQVRDLEDKVKSLMTSLAHYAPVRLGAVETPQGKFCELARFLRYLVTLEDGPVRAGAYDLAQAISTAYIQCGRSAKLGKGVIEVKGLNHWRVGQVLAMSQWPAGSIPGMSDAFHRADAEMIITQKFFPIDKLDANLQASTYERRLGKAEDTAEQALQIKKILKRQAANRSITGTHHMSVLVHVPIDPTARDPEGEALIELDDAVSRVGEVFKGWGVPPIVETTGMERAFWSQVPGASKRHNGRVGKIETLQFADFASMHGYPQGRFKGLLWGDCLHIFPTQGGTVYCFNFHESRPGMVPGHLNVVAKSGVGKTTLVAVLVSQADKVQPRVLWYDRYDAATVFFEALGGKHIVLGSDQSLGNPCKMEDTPANRAMLRDLIRMMAECYGYKVTTDDYAKIQKAVEDNFDDTKTPFKDRRLRHMMWQFGRGSGLYEALKIWVEDGANGAVFDGDEEDTLDLQSCRHIRVEMKHVMKDKEARPELEVYTGYLTHRFEQTLDGRPTIVVWDEAQILVRTQFWQHKIETYRETFRRRNCVTVFITPDPKALYYPVEAVMKQAVYTIYLANDQATPKDYIENLYFSRSEFEFVRDAQPAEYKMLIKPGSGPSVRASFAMPDMADLIPVLSSNDKAVELMERVKAELETTDPERWVPVFCRRAAELRTHNV